MAVRIREINNINILDIEGNIDINSSDIIEMVGWLVNTGKLQIILNLENAGLVDYSGLSVLAIAYKNVVNHKGKIKFAHVSLPAMEMFKIVRLDGLFESYADVEAALKSFSEEEIDKLALRRKFTRLDIHLRVKYRITDPRTDEERKVFEGDALNISAAGVYIYSSSKLPINTKVDLEFMIPSTNTALAADGKVVWHADKEIQPHSYPGMGVAFTHLSSEKEQRIIDFIDKNITHRAEPY
ncbi:MAG: PilZ domain-containing protein [Candidatus Omnitrophica bacterium]|nr:PilZ domain-containing protein [Candidatus Omnitrophota bacterium]